MGAVEGEQFITKLALDILDGRSFDINGRKCTYEQLFAEVEFAEVVRNQFMKNTAEIYNSLILF